MNNTETIARNLEKIRGKIDAACRRSARRSQEVTLLAVSKTKPTEDLRAAMAAGQRAFGENYVQELLMKAEELGYAIPHSIGAGTGETDPDETHPVWHMIGHLQRNKVKYIVGKTALIHAVDSIPLAAQIEKEAAKRNLVCRVLLEVNVAGESTKWGFSLEETKQAAQEMTAFPHVCLCGLMTSAPYTQDPETNRLFFRALKNMNDTLAREGLLGKECTAPVLSMGMSGDYEVAVEEGATIVRVGTAIFGERNYHT